MLKIEIIDPSKLDQRTLIATAKYLFNLAGHEVGEAPIDPRQIASKVSSGVKETIKAAAIESVTPPMQEPIIPAVPPPVKSIEPTLTTDDTELDTDGMPWDARIHARTKSKTAEGTWSLKRGVDLKLVTEVTNELKPQENPFLPLMSKITAAINTNVLTREQVNEALKSVGAESLPAISTQPELITQLQQLLGL